MGSQNNFPGPKKGDRLTAKQLAAWIAGSKSALARKLAALASPGNGVPLEPAARIRVINTSDVDIPVGAPISLEEISGYDEASLFGAWSFNVVLLEDAEAESPKAAVAADLIPARKAGEAYIAGACLAALTDDNAGLIAAAGLTTLWEEDDEGDRWAIVRFGGASVAVVPIYIIGGNSLGTYGAVTSYGITKQNVILSGITTQVYSPGECNPTTGAETVAPSPAITLWPSGIGFGTALTAAGYVRVIVINDLRSGPATLLVGSSTSNPTRAPSPLEGMVYATRMGTVSLLDDSTISGYIPDFG